MSLRFALLAVGLAGCAAAQSPAPAPTPPAPAPPAATPPAAPPVPPGMQWLYGSGEGGAASIQAYHVFRDYVLAAVRSRPRESVVLADGATLDAPRFVPCADKPLAVILDSDETAIQNLGYEYDEAVRGLSYDQERWNRFERTGADTVLPMPGALTALRAIREAGVKVFFVSNRRSENAAGNVDALNRAGVGPARHLDNAYYEGDIAPGSGKDPRRAHIAASHCVVAMAGDQLGDFSDLFNARELGVPARRRAAISGPYAGMWGNGWFVLSNPVYGRGLRGDFDDVFPPDRRWSDPQGGNR